MIVKRTILAFLLIVLLAGPAAPAVSASPESYNYNIWVETVPAPPSYIPKKVVYGDDLRIGPFDSPQDLYVGKDKKIYIADTGNNRIVVLDERFNLDRIIADFENGGKKDAFHHPEGIFVDDNGDLYVADTNNRRLLQFTAQGQMVREIAEPRSSLIRQGFQFAPSKLVIDKAKQIYVISRGSYEGIMQFDSDGEFSGFMGTNPVSFSPADLFWKRISTKAQRDRMEQFIPVEFNNLDMDPEGFIFTTTSEEHSSNPIQRFNLAGVNILRKEGSFPPLGDLKYSYFGSRPGSSVFIDIAADEGGIYSALDAKRGRIFTYDKDGNLLYIFGDLGSQKGTFRTPSAIGISGDRILVLDKDYGRVTVFEPTRYAGLIREAVIHLYNGKVDLSTSAWQKVLQLNANLDVAYIGIGKSLLKKGENREAMEYFKLGHNRDHYSEAFERYRKEIVKHDFGYIVLALALCIGLTAGVVKLARRKTAGRHYEEIGILKNPFYTMLHPFNGFWEMKFEQKGRIKIALGILVLFVLLNIVKRQFSGFVVNHNDLTELNSIDELLFVIVPFVLWCGANWSITTLMDGEGKFKEVVMAAGYSLMPFVVLYLPQTIYSNVITVNEGSFYYLLDSMAYLWFVWLLFVGTMTVHQYSAGKTILTMLLTLAAMGIIIFIGLLFFSMLQQMIHFVTSIREEFSFRF